MNKLRVAVIGGGSAGLCAARYMAARPDRFEPVVFEKAERVGGTWVYTEETGKDKHGLPIHSSMYSSLKTNLPKEVMAFPDFPFDAKLPSFVKHTDMLEYIDQYSQRFNLLQYIQFCKVVESVKPIKVADETQPVSWEVKVRDLRDQESEPITAIYDAVMICNGHFALPKTSAIEGLDTFPGTVLHSHNYRHPSIFQNESVLVIGAGQSGIDIALDMSPHAKQVYLSHWRPRLKTSLPRNVKEVQDVKSLSRTEVQFTDGTKAGVDAILFCTGYDYDFSFLHPDCKLNVTDGRITPLYKHVIHSAFPSLSVIGIAIRICPYPHFSAQAQFILAALDGTMKLPTREEMVADEARDYQERLARGFPHRYAHYLGERQWDYNDELLRMAKAERHTPVTAKLYEDLAVLRRTDVCNYKKLNFKLLDDESYEQLETMEQ